MLSHILKCFHIHSSYVEPLAKALEAEKWSLVQPLFTSSYTGFGTSSLKEVSLSDHIIYCLPYAMEGSFLGLMYMIAEGIMGTVAFCNLVAGRERRLNDRSGTSSYGVACSGCSRD